jgi:hypothetical protein
MVNIRFYVTRGQWTVGEAYKIIARRWKSRFFLKAPALSKKHSDRLPYRAPARKSPDDATLQHTLCRSFIGAVSNQAYARNYFLGRSA